MAITATERTNILELLIIMFDAAPGATYLDDIVAVYEANGHNLLSLANTLGDTGIFQSLHPNFQTLNEFVTDALSSVGLENDAVARERVAEMITGGDWNRDGIIDPPMTKAQAMYTIYNVLDNLPSFYGPQYQAAAETMHNKAEVSEYYSVTLGGTGTSIAELQDVVNDVDETQASVDAAKDELDDQLATGPTLTPGIDIIDVGQLRGDAATNIEGVVDGDDDGSTAASTFNPGDDITGNGNTNLNLVVVEGGDAGFMRLDTIEAVNIEAGTNGTTITFNAGGWTNVGEVMLNSGVDGLDVFLDNLEAGTVIGVMDVTGSVSASYDTDSGNLFMWVSNNDEGGEGITGVATAEGDVTILGADSVSATLYNNTGVDLGTVDVTMLENAFFSMYFSDEGYSVGDVNVTVGGGSSVSFTGAYVSGDQTWSDVDVTVGDSSSVNFSFWNGEDGDLTMGDITVVAGDTLDFEMSITDMTTANVTVGDVMVTAGDDSELDIYVSDVDTGDITFGDISLVGGVDSTVNVTFSGDGDYYGEDYGQMVTLGNVTLTAGDAGTTTDMDGFASVGLAVYSWSSLDVGDVNLTVGASGSIDVSFSHISNDVTVGNVTLMGGEGSDVEFGINEIGTPLGFPTGPSQQSAGDGTVTVGNITAEGEDIQVFVTNSGTGTGDVTIGDISMTASGSASITISDHANNTLGNVTIVAALDVDVYVEAESAMTLTVDGEDSVVIDLSDITVGNIDISVTADGASASVSLDNGDNNSMANVGAITVGNVDMVAQDDGSVYFYAWNYATASTTVSNTGTAAGGITVGDVTMTIGSATDLEGTAEATVSISQWAGAGAVGDVSVGDVTVTVGDGFASGTQTNEATGSVWIYNWGEDGAGDMTVGDVNMTGGDFVSLTFTAELSAASYTDNSIDTGLLTVGNIDMVGGESANLEAYVYNYAYGDDNGSNGGILVGDVNIMAAQDSFVSVSVSAWNWQGQEMGDLTVGDVNITMGDNSTAELYVYQWGGFTATEDVVDGDYLVGNVSIAVSATETEDLSGGSFITATFSKSFSSMTGFDAGSFTVGDVTLSAVGDDADVYLGVEDYGYADLMGDVTLGTLAVTIGDDSTNDSEIYVFIANYATGGDIGDVTIEGLSMTVGDSSTASITVDISKDGIAGDVGNVSFGNITVVAGDSSTVDVNLSISDMLTDSSVGNIAIGDVMVTVGESSTVNLDDLYFTAQGSGTIGDFSIGDFIVDAGENSGVYFDVTVTGSADIGNITLGDVDITAAGANITDSVTYSVGAFADGDIGDVTVGNWNVVLGEGGVIGYLTVSVTASGDIGHVMVGDVTIDADISATIGGTSDYAGVFVSADGDVDGSEVGDVTITATDGGAVSLTYDIVAGGSAGDMTIGDVMLTVEDSEVTVTTDTNPTNPTTGTNTFDVGGTIKFYATVSGDANDVLTVGDLTIEVGGTAVSDEVWVTLTNGGNGDIVIGDVTVSGAGTFILDGQAHTGTDNVSFLDVNTTGEITIGDIDFTGYESDVSLDLSWTDAGAANISGGEGNDTIVGNDDDNIITGNEGNDEIDITDDAGNATVTNGGDDIIVTNVGDSGTTAATIDTITGFDGDDTPVGAADGDKLDFNFVAGTAGNYVEGDGTSSLTTFLSEANDMLNSTVKYYADYDGVYTYVAVNFGSGEADLVIALTGNQLADLSFANIIA